MKILHVLDHSIPLHSGYTFRTRAILEQQRALGWQTVHLTSTKHSAPGPDVEEVDGLRFYRTRPSQSLLSRLPVMDQLDVINTLDRRLDEVIHLEQPDILHAHSPSLNGTAAIRAGRRHGIPVVYECRAFWEDAAVDHGTINEGGMRYRITRAMETRVFQQADAVTTICEGLRSDIIDRGLPDQKVTVIPNAVDIEKFSDERQSDTTLAQQLGIGGCPVIGFIGSFYAYEGLDLLIAALPEIQQQIPKIRLLLIGGGPQEQNLQQQAARSSVADAIQFTGRVPHQEVQRYYDLIDVFAYPRHRMRLTELVTPLKPLEAMAQGRMVIASDVGGHKELITDGENGRLFPAGDSGALAQVATELFSNTACWPEYAQRGRAYVEQQRNWPVSVARYQSVYGSLNGADHG